MSKVTEVRLTLAALIYGIEIDLKSKINKNIVPYFSDLNFFQNQELIDKVSERYSKENPGIDILLNIEDSIDYLDFHDTFVILNKNKSFLTKQESDYLKVMHCSSPELHHFLKLECQNYSQVWSPSHRLAVKPLEHLRHLWSVR